MGYNMNVGIKIHKEKFYKIKSRLNLQVWGFQMYYNHTDEQLKF